MIRSALVHMRWFAPQGSMGRVLGAKQQLAEMAVCFASARGREQMQGSASRSNCVQTLCGLGDRRLWIYGDGQHVVRASSPVGGITEPITEDRELSIHS
jgi:hypothetical protein